jgi:hypothetical protein
MMNFVGNAIVSDVIYGQPFPALVYTRYVDICSRNLTNYQKVKDNSTRENQTPAVLCRLYLGNYLTEGMSPNSTASWVGSGPTVLQRIYNVPKYASWSPGAFIDQIDIQLRDDVGNLLYIPGLEDDPLEATNFAAFTNSCSFQLTLHASES